MSSRGTHGSPENRARLPDAIPFALPAVTRLGWELGDRVTRDEDAVLREEWEHTASGRRLAVYDVTDYTVVLGVRTPAGRERFYGAAEADLDREIDGIESADDWRRC